MTARVLVRRATAALTLALVAACSSDSNTGPKGSFALVAPTRAVAVPSGSGGSTIIAISRSGGFNGAVTFTVEGLQPGVTATVAPAVVTSNVTTVRVDYAIAPGTATGNQTLTVRGTSKGVADQTATVTLAVAAGAGYTLGLPTSAITIYTDSFAALKTNIARTGSFAGVVNVTATGLPTGLTFGFQTVSGDTGSVIFRAAGTTTPGTYTVTLTDQNLALGTSSQRTVQVTVLVKPGFSFTLTPSAIAVVRGSSTTVTVNTTRVGGFSNAITYTITGTPRAGVTATVAQTGDMATVTVTASATAAIVSDSGLTLTATSPGASTQSARLRITPVTGIVTNNTALALPAGDDGTEFLYAITVPTGATSIKFTTGGGTGDIDLYARGIVAPGFTRGVDATCTSEGANTNETCTIASPVAGLYFVRILGFGPFSGASLTVSILP